MDIESSTHHVISEYSSVTNSTILMFDWCHRHVDTVILSTICKAIVLRSNNINNINI